MFIHIFKYRFLGLVRDRNLIFWTMIFPLVLATFFKLSLGNLNEQETFRAIPIGIIDDEGYQKDQGFKDTIESLSTGEDPMFEVTLLSEADAKSQLLSGALTGVIRVGETKALMVNQTEISQSIIKVFLEQYSQTNSAVISIVSSDPQKMGRVMEVLGSNESFTEEVSVSKEEPNNILMYFYSLIAMACFYGSFFGLREVTHIQADLSTLGARVNLTPVHKLKAFVYSTTSSILIQFIEIMILIAYLTFGLGIDFGSRIGLVILTVFIGCIVGIAMGAFIASLLKGSEGMKVGICIGTSMLGSFLAGMMVADIKYLVDTKAPIVSHLNPINVLTDALYSLYYYDNFDRYISNMLNLSVFVVIFVFGTYAALRRKKYASI